LSKLPLVEGIEKYVNENNISFCMPGHKGGLGFLATKEGKALYSSLIKSDVTEVEGMDNLHKPEGIIKEAMTLLKDFYGSKKSYFLVNGSTSGNLAMIFAAFNEGDKVIVERNCHRSIFNGIIMRKLQPIYIKNKINEKYNAPLSIDMEHFLCLIEENKDAKGIIITYPNYYGICTDLEFIVKKAKQYGMKVLVDEAHGPHFGINDEIPKSAIELGADMVVMSAHKTLPSLTQTAYLHVAGDMDIEKVDFYVSAFLSTSPSYMFLASMDYARFYLQEYGKDAYRNLLSLCRRYREKINELPHFYILGQEDLEWQTIDETRYVLNVEKGHSAHKLLDYLKSEGIQGEMSDGSSVILIFSPFNSEEDFLALYKALKKWTENIPVEYKEEAFVSFYNNFDTIEKKLAPYEVMEKKKYLVDLRNSEGRVSRNAIVPYPPGVPLIMPGEVIDEKVINVIKYYLDNDITVLGIEEQKLWIVEE
jgi:arginine/lysine/ornithine decarboxylase